MNADPIQTAITELYREFGVEGVKPQWAIINQDCRDGDEGRTSPSLTGQSVLYLGNFIMPSVLTFRDPTDASQVEADSIESARLHDALCVHPAEYPEDTEFEIAMPLLLSDTGDIIWGCECYWGEVDRETVELAERFGLKNVALDLIEEATQKFKTSTVYRSLRKLLEAELSGEKSGEKSSINEVGDENPES